MKKKFNLLISSVALLAITGSALNASEEIVKYDNLHQVVNPNGKKAYVLNYTENVGKVLDKKLTINIPELPYKATFNLCPNVKEANECKSTIYVRKDNGDYLVDYKVVFLDEMKGNKPIITELESEESPMILNEISDDDELYIYRTLSTHTRYWMLKDK
jgi:hypothetical protein